MKTLLFIFICITLQQCVPFASSAPRQRRQLPCTHPLRLSLPDLFSHCDSAPCTYGSWSSWERVPGSVTPVSSSLCASEKAYTEQRTRVATGSGCNEPLSETQNICLPTQEELLIIALGLGGSGNNFEPIDSGAPPPPPPVAPPGNGGGGKTTIVSSFKVGSPAPTRRCPQYGGNGQICSHLPGIGKRSIDKLDQESPKRKQTTKLHKTKLVVNESNGVLSRPIPFDWFEHGPRLRQRRQTQCGDSSVQNVLFVLDSSGSIGRSQYERMKTALGKLTPLFCKQVRFALITFSSYVNLEFCFNCFENTYQGRLGVQTAIGNALYQGDLTYTAGAAKCVCDELLHSSCGIDSSPDCLDVVFITDGQSNDPSLEVCEEVRCLHNRFGVNTYAIGINNYNLAELQCIDHYSDALSAFQFESFSDFESSITNIERRLLNALPTSPESCLRRDASLSPSGAPPFR